MEGTIEEKLAKLRSKNAELESLEIRDKERTQELKELESEQVH